MSYNESVAIDIPFLKKFSFPKLSLAILSRKPTGLAGIDLGIHSAKVVQLKYAGERAILETYGELLARGYLKGGGGTRGGFLRYLDSEIAALVIDLLRESNVTVRDAVFSIPATASFVTTIPFPRLSRKEVEAAVPFEARKYVPIPISEVVIDWDILDSEEGSQTLDVLLAAVPREIIEKFKRVAKLSGVNPRALEVETFSMTRSLVGPDPTPTALINLGHQSTTLAIVDRGKLRVSHNFDHGSQDLTRALERSLGVNRERAETIKRDTGLSERIEEREIASTLLPLVEALLTEIERLIALYNRRAPRRIQKINLTGGGSGLQGLLDYVSTKMGIEVTLGNPFSRVVAPAFMQPIIRDIGPSFSVAVGLALREITAR